MKSMSFTLAVGAVASLALTPASFAATCPDRAPAAITAPTTDAGKACQAALAKAAADYVKAELKTDAGCMAKQTLGLCPNAKDTAKIQKAAIKSRDAVVKACSTGLADLANSYSTFTDPALVSSCSLSQVNVEGKLLAYTVNGQPVDMFGVLGANDKNRGKCMKTLSGAGVKYALGALSAINKCVASNIKDGTPGDLAAVCVGQYSGGTFTAPTDLKTAEKLAALVAKAEASIDKACGSISALTLATIPACGGAASVADLKTCIACESWDSILDVVKVQYSETGTLVSPGTDAIQNAVDASGPGAKLLIQSGTYEEDVTISKHCSGGPNDGDACGVDSDCTPGTCASPHANLQIVGCGGASNEKPFIDVPSTGGPYTNGITASGVDGLVFQTLNVGAWPENGLFAAGAEGVTFRDVYSDALDVSKYAVFPIQSNNVLVEGCEVHHVSDAGIYVGQSTNIIARYNTVIENVAGLEIENSQNAKVHNVYATGNSGGILIFKLPGLPVQLSNGHEISHNILVSNNRANIGSGTVGLVPDGTGMLVLSNDDGDFHHNFMDDNDSFGFVLVDQQTLNVLSGSNVFDPTSPDQKATGNQIRLNHVTSNNGTNQDSTPPNTTQGQGGKIVYEIIEEDPAPNYNFNCFDSNTAAVKNPITGAHVDQTCP
jgi:parallel beta-helix repeat protein